MSAVGLIAEGHAGDDPDRIRELMSGNICPLRRLSRHHRSCAGKRREILAEREREDAA